MSTSPQLPPDPDQQSEESAQDFFSPQVRYSGPDVTCAQCEYFDGSSQCSNPKKIADNGPEADPGGRCEEFDPKEDQGEEGDALMQQIQKSAPMGMGK